MLKINEIFFSIQGESSWAGEATVFVRTTGCPLRCQYCDTKYSYYEGEMMSLEDIIDRVQSFGTRFVCVTGGEPLVQKESLTLMSRLCDLGLKVSLETSGARSVAEVDPRVKIILDVKTPGSKEEKTFLLENLQLCEQSHRVPSEIKFVLCSEEDFEWAEHFCRQHELFEKFCVLYSPSFTEFDPRRLADKILEKKSRGRLQLQLHKYIWLPETRGV